MAVLNPTQLTALRNKCEEYHRLEAIQINYHKPAINAVLQAIEDQLEAAKPGINAAITAALVPHGITLTAQQRRRIFAAYLGLKVRLEAP